MNELTEPTDNPCCIRNCPATATHYESGETFHWSIKVHYCDEHARELNHGIPVGPAGIDSGRFEVHPKGVEAPSTGGTSPSLSPQ